MTELEVRCMVDPDRMQAWERQYLEDGFVVVPGEIAPTLLHDCNRGMEVLIARAEELGKQGVVRVRKSERASMEGAGWSWGCDHIFRPELCDLPLLELASAPPFPELLHQILGPRIRFSGGHGHWSPVTSDYYLHWHRDTRREHWVRANPDPRCHVQLCVALRDEAVVRLVPGSHLRELSGEELERATRAPHAAHPDQVVPTIQAASALLLNTYTLHRAQCSRTAPRRSLHFGFTRVGAAAEPGRLGNVQRWMRDPAFLAAQTPFMRVAMREQIISEA